MKRLLALFLLVSPALAQTVTDPTPIALVCAYNSVIPAPTSGQYAFVQCDSTGKLITAGGSGGTPGGSSGQIQYNNAGAFGGFTVSGDGTLNSSTGALVVTKTNGSAFGTAAIVNTGTSGATIPLLNAANTWGATQTFGTNALTLNGTSLLSDAANTTAFRNSTTAQKLSIYNTYTDASNYERGVLDWQTNANILTIGTQNAGTGTARQVQFQTGGTGGASGFKWVQNTTVVATLDTSAGLSPGVDDNYNFGSSSKRWYNGFFSQYMVVSGRTVATLTAAATAGVGARAFVTDATACTFGGAITGGGSTKCPVYSDGTSWLGG